MNTNNKTTKFVEDILAQDEFDPADLIDAKHKHPVLHWIRLNWKLQKLNVELKLSVLVGRAKAAAAKLFTK